MRDQAFNLLLACCWGNTRYRIPEEDGRFWSELLGEARREGISPLVHHRLPAILGKTAAIPDGIREEFTRDYYTVAGKNAVIFEALARLLTLLHEAAIPVMVLKGAVLAEKIYGNPALRGMADADLLIHPQNLPALTGILAELGYTSPDLHCIDPADPARGFLTSVVFLPPFTPPVPFHLHWHFINSSIPNRRLMERVSMDPIWEEAMETDLAGAPALVMAPHHFLLHLCEHSLRVTHSLAKLRYVCDLHATIRHHGPDLDWDRFVAAALGFGLAPFMRVPLLTTAHLLGTPVPPEVLAALATSKTGMAGRLFERLARHTLPPAGSSYLLHLAINRGLAAKMRFLLQTCFPPRQVLAQRSGLALSEVGPGDYLQRLAAALAGGFTAARRIVLPERRFPPPLRLPHGS